MSPKFSVAERLSRISDKLTNSFKDRLTTKIPATAKINTSKRTKQASVYDLRRCPSQGFDRPCLDTIILDTPSDGAEALKRESLLSRDVGFMPMSPIAEGFERCEDAFRPTLMINIFPPTPVSESSTYFSGGVLAVDFKCIKRGVIIPFDEAYLFPRWQPSKADEVFEEVVLEDN